MTTVWMTYNVWPVANYSCVNIAVSIAACQQMSLAVFGRAAQEKFHAAA